MSRTILDVHVLQTVPPSNINRDDTGSPKGAVYGGVRRARVSSQAWKRATREAFNRVLPPEELGTRTKRVAELVAERIVELDDSIAQEEALELAAATVTAATGSKVEKPKRRKGEEEDRAPESSYLMFLSARQRDGLAELAVQGRSDIKAFLKDAETKKRAKQIANTGHSVDIALFGRMVADSSDINVDASAQVAHAISVHAAEIEADYYTAVDDRRKDDEPGAGMIGTVEFNSATLYRYAAVDVDRLASNLGAGIQEGRPAAEPVRRSVEAFIRCFVESMPTGKSNTFANHSLPSAVIVKLRDARPISFAGAFEAPVPQDTPDGQVGHACAKLAEHIAEIEHVYGAAGAKTWLLRVGEATKPLEALGAALPLDQMVGEVGQAVAARMENPA
ncbi:type I-E CRISPR-associated protein Cas7/Cse4/CasC [Nocardiopsis sp. RSe5-2]|uniref:Type I-E CRISPR-associated protein Cas7/Cse4/CasC n=1 Tax=Nocardiopsis endophytica TaxID=3018445 RepID=A0ABT4TWW4_9ACTN|nr:type I-E CRISPR-associated protein Cas7/Cse4/CasC [Nocardiopsis endophytica]MDA2809189.1 type I-E CRISPR-associated protein Cas7/Cse4/CasC [Nocardiopsis endophytica]